MVVVSKRHRNDVHFTSVKDSLDKYNNVILLEMNPVRTKVLHKLRESMRNTAKIIFGKKTIIKKVFKNINENFLKLITANTFLVFTNDDWKRTIETIVEHNTEETQKIIRKGVLMTGNQPAPTVIKKHLDSLNLITKEQHGTLFLENDVQLDNQKDKKIIKLLKMDDTSMSIKPLCVLEDGKFQKI